MKTLINIMDSNTLKIYGANALAFFVSLADLDAWIKTVTLIVVLGYSVFKALNEYNKWKSSNNKNEEDK